MIFVFAVMIAMVASVKVLANSYDENCCVHNHDAFTTQVTVQGKHCTGTVGCSCTILQTLTWDDIDWESLRELPEKAIDQAMLWMRSFLHSLGNTKMVWPL